MDSPATFPTPMRASGSRESGRSRQADTSGSEVDSADTDSAGAFDQVWNRTMREDTRSTVGPASASGDSLSPPEGLDSLDVDRQSTEAASLSREGLPLSDEDIANETVSVLGLPLPLGEHSTSKPLPQGVAPVETAVDRGGRQGEGVPDSEQSPWKGARPVPGHQPQGVSTETSSPLGASAPRQAQEGNPPQAVPPVPGLPQKPPVIPAAENSSRPRPEFAVTAPTVRQGKGNEIFLPTDNQLPKVGEENVGISVATPGSHMRRPSEKRSSNAIPASMASRLSAGSLRQPVVNLRSGVSPSIETEFVRTELETGDRIAALSPAFEGSGAASSASGIQNGSLAGMRQASASSVLEMVSRMADQLAARGQERLSMTIRFEDGGSIRIRMIREKGEIRALFQTDLPGLESALRQHWSQFSQDAQNRGLRFNSMAFMSANTSPDRGDARSGETFDRYESLQGDGVPVSAPMASDTAETPSASSPSEKPILSRGPGRLRAWV